MRPSLLAWFLALIPSAAVAGAPFWAQHDSQRLDGKIFRIVCSGTGPSIGFARQNALDSCKVSAAQQLATDVVVKSVSVTSETQAAFQQEVVNESQVTGLSCTPKREETEETDAEVKLWLLCEFDLSKARIVAARPVDRHPDSASQLAGILSDERTVLTLAVVPGCTDVIIRGGSPARVVSCGGLNPVSVVLRPDDRELTLRAKDYLPKTLFLGPERAARDYVQVYLEPNP
jgi:hypothetical protein